MFESLLDATDAAIGAFIFDAWGSFIAVAGDWITAMMILYVVITGYLMLIGRFGGSFGDWFVRVIKLVFIFVLVTNIDLLTRLLFELFTNVPESIASHIAGVGGDDEGGINVTIGEVWAQGLSATQNIFQEASLTSWSPVLFAAIVLVVTILAIVYITFLVMLAKLAVAVLLGVAPFFIMLYLFESTKSIFEGWMRQLLTFALVPIFLYALLALVIDIVKVMSDQMIAATASEAWGITHVGPYALVMLVSLLLTTQVLGWAAGVAGGFSLSTVGTFRSSGRAALAAGAGMVAGTRALATRLRNRGRPDADAVGATLASNRTPNKPARTA